jgi:medium-chain acyl-[acyl-carrier-protein] hydrolase
MIKIYKDEFQVRSYEVGFNGIAKTSTILDYFQELASTHAHLLGFSVEQLFKRGMTWVLSRNHIKILRAPEFGEKILGQTWPSGRKGRFALRDYEMYDGDGSLIVQGTTSWMMIDLKSKKPVRVADLLADTLIVEQRALIDDFKALPALSHPDFENSFSVRLSDLDINRHVNNVVYIEWVMDTLPRDIIYKYYPSEIEISYRSEALLGDIILSKAQQPDRKENIFIHQLIRNEDGKELALLHTSWKKI